MEWIKVTDRLPEQNRVLVFRSFGIQYTAWFNNGDFYDTLGDILTGKSIEITHWMPLPEPPKE